MQTKVRQYRKALGFLVGVYGVVLLVVTGLPYWPASLWPLATFVSALPWWGFAWPLVLLLPSVWLTRQFGLLLALLLSCGLLYSLSGAVWMAASEEDPDDGLLAITANMANGGEVGLLNQLIVENNADLVAVQGISQAGLAPLLNQSPMNVVCADTICLLSHMPLTLVAGGAQPVVRGTGQFALHASIHLPSGVVDVTVLYLAAAASGLRANPVTGWWRLQEATEQLMTENWLASNQVAQGKQALVLGDFNLVRSNPMFDHYWQGLRDSFAESGSGLGHSTGSLGFSRQAAHILHSAAWRTVRTWLGPSLGGVNRPLLTVLVPVAMQH